MHKELIQQSPEWFQTRKLKLTASCAQAIGNNGKGLESLVRGLVRCHITGTVEDEFSSDDTGRGNELEAVARDIYELDKNVKVETVGFIEADEHVGFSPDGLIGDDGLLEIKCPDNKKYYDILLDGEKSIDTKYVWQVQMQLLLSGRAWADLVFYNPNFRESMLIFRITPDEEKFRSLEEGLEKGVTLITTQLALFA